MPAAGRRKLTTKFLIGSKYGDELKRRLEIRAYIEDSETLQEEYFRELGLTTERFEWDSLFDRWILLRPLDMEITGMEKYPLVFWQHGGYNSIESELCMTGFAEIAAREKFMLVHMQNTNWQNVDRLIDFIGSQWPLDRQRIYIGGFSQGGQQAISAFSHLPWKFAAALTTGADIYRPHDSQDILYIYDEMLRLKKYTVPLMQMCGECELFSYAPLNDFTPPVFNAEMNKQFPKASSDTSRYHGRIMHEKDPTRIYDPNKGILNALFAAQGIKNELRMSSKYNPPEGEDSKKFSLMKVNKRMELLNCEERNVEICAAYNDSPEDLIHYKTGIYGDYEGIEEYKGLKHYRVDIKNRDGITAYSFVVVSNFTHWIPLSLGEWGWDFFKQYRRDTLTGKIITRDKMI